MWNTLSPWERENVVFSAPGRAMIISLPGLANLDNWRPQTAATALIPKSRVTDK
jgi:hypothetical protein